MALVAKRNHEMTLVKNNKGQISIFFSASLIVLISIVAFVINIGLFVKAKINLQNATDAAAFSGAAVQARQLSKISYLNWEMRNIYKEWMYKYYVIGNINAKSVENPDSISGDVMSFRLADDRNVLTGTTTKDPYNIPAVCIHIAGSKTNICKRYSIPGLPEFGSSELPGAEEASRRFMDVLISTKVDDCIDRTRLNMLVATTWTYNVMASSMDESLAGRGPAILADRQGAWPRAVELAMRIRNLEYAMNRPAIEGGVCNSGSTPYGATNCNQAINAISQEKKLGNERMVKAFYSGYRNLGNDVDNEMKESFTLTEIPPRKVPFTKDADASYLLVPEDKARTYEKQWVDLKLMMVNYAIFYAAMIPRADSATSGACDVSKVAIPVPGYPMGFYKNPDVLTYYAVKGEAEFVGMFNPFNNESVKMTAYSAAKPFGGRVGPMLFVQPQGKDWFVGRTDSAKLRSIPYITSFDFVGTPTRFGGPLKLGDFEPGVPLPANSAIDPGPFWLSREDSPLGGLVADASGVEFGVPNMPYDYQEKFRSTGYSSGGVKIHTMKSAPGSEELPIGLYSKDQFKMFRGSSIPPTITPQTLDEEIARVRAPTLYEAANYLIPTPNEFNIEEGLDSFGFVSTPTSEKLSNGITRYHADVYAPLHGGETDQVDILYDGQQNVKASIFEFMRRQESGMEKYKMSLNQAARSVYAQKDRVAAGAQGSAVGYEKAASGISDIDFTNPDNHQNPKTCTSIAGQFLHFYYNTVTDGFNVADPTGCPESLGQLLEKYFSSGNNEKDPSFSSTHYRLSLSWPTDEAKGRSMLTAYRPGPFTGVGYDGVFTNPIPGSEISEKMQRNFYSTKFVSLDSLRDEGGYNEQNSNFVIYSEGALAGSNAAQDRKQNGFKNALDPEIIGSDLNSIDY